MLSIIKLQALVFYNFLSYLGWGIWDLTCDIKSVHTICLFIGCDMRESETFYQNEV